MTFSSAHRRWRRLQTSFLDQWSDPAVEPIIPVTTRCAGIIRKTPDRRRKRYIRHGRAADDSERPAGLRARSRLARNVRRHEYRGSGAIAWHETAAHEEDVGGVTT